MQLGTENNSWKSRTSAHRSSLEKSRRLEADRHRAGKRRPTPQIRVLRLLITDYGEADLELTEYAPITQLAAGGYQHAKKEFRPSGLRYSPQRRRQQRELWEDHSAQQRAQSDSGDAANNSTNLLT